MSLEIFRAAVLEFWQSFSSNELLLRQKWLLGLVNLSLVVVFWVMSSFLVNELFESDIYRKPFFITYVNTSCFVFYLIPYLRHEGLLVGDLIRKLKGPQYQPVDSPSYGSELSIEEPSDLEEISIQETVRLSLQFIVLWFSANLVTNASLSYTLVASQTILSTTSSFFTLIIGYLYLIEKINQNKVIGIILSFSGVVIVTKIDATATNSIPQNNWYVLWGNLLALAGALIYGIYTILLKFKIMIPNSPRERNLNTHLFFGFVGLYCLVFLWPVLVVLHFTDLEHFALPTSSHVFTLLGINAFITFISDFCWCKAVLLTSPLTVTVGLSLTIPLAMVGDWFIKGFDLNGWYVFGAVIVTLGFLVINKDEQEDFVDSDPLE